MGQRIIAENAHVNSVSYALPNKHYVPVDMKYIGLDNMSPCVIGLFYCSFPASNLTVSCFIKAEGRGIRTPRGTEVSGPSERF